MACYGLAGASAKRMYQSGENFVSTLLDSKDDIKKGECEVWIKRRDTKSIYNLIRQLATEDNIAYKDMTRMKYEKFCET